MNVNSYTELQDTVASYLARTDLSEQIPTFIKFAEFRLRRELRIRQMLKSVTTTTVAGDSTIQMPVDFLEIRDFVLNTTPTQSLSYQSPSYLSRDTRSTQVGKPTDYTILASEFQLAPIPDGVYTAKLLYFATPDLLSNVNPSNAFLTTVPDMLVYASLLEAEPYIMNDARLQTWIAMYERASSSVTKSDDSSQYSGVPLSMKTI